MGLTPSLTLTLNECYSTLSQRKYIEGRNGGDLDCHDFIFPEQLKYLDQNTPDARNGKPNIKGSDLCTKILENKYNSE